LRSHSGYLTYIIELAQIARRGGACGAVSPQAAHRPPADVGEEAEKPFKLVAVALGNKMARIAKGKGQC
jgi:hypothetical protein